MLIFWKLDYFSVSQIEHTRLFLNSDELISFSKTFWENFWCTLQNKEVITVRIPFSTLRKFESSNK